MKIGNIFPQAAFLYFNQSEKVINNFIFCNNRCNEMHCLQIVFEKIMAGESWKHACALVVTLVVRLVSTNSVGSGLNVQGLSVHTLR